MSPSGNRAGGSSSRLAVRGGFVGRLAGNRTGTAERSGYQRPSVAVDLAGGFITNLSVLISLVMRRLPKKETRKSCVTEGETWRSAAGRRAWRSSFPALPTRAGAHGPARPAGAGMLPSEPRRGRPQGGVEGEGLGAGFAQSSASRSGRGRFAAGGGGGGGVKMVAAGRGPRERRVGPPPAVWASELAVHLTHLPDASPADAGGRFQSNPWSGGLANTRALLSV